MVRIKNNIFGKASGKMNNVVYRVMNGKSFASYRPVKYNASKSEAAVFQRSKFAVTIEFAKYINSIPVLSSIWKVAGIKGTTSFNRIVKYNIKVANDKSPTVNNIITPSNCTKNLLNIAISDLRFSPSGKKIIIDLIKDATVISYNREQHLVFVFALCGPVNKKEKFFELEHREEIICLTGDKEKINYSLDFTLLNKISRYKKMLIYFSASACVSGGLKYFWSEPYSKEFIIDP
jgi:hypothetical protein